MAGDRRPIAARRLRVVQAAAARLAQAGVSADAISLAGLAAGLGAGAALAATGLCAGPWLWLAGGVLVALRLLANMLDGMVAERGGGTSAYGELYNEVPDRLSDVAILVGLGYGAGSSPELGYAAALGALLTAYVRAFGRPLAGRQEFCGPMAKQQRMALVIAVAAAGVLAGDWAVEARLPAVALGIIALGAAATAVRRLRRVAQALAAR